MEPIGALGRSHKSGAGAFTLARIRVLSAQARNICDRAPEGEPRSMYIPARDVLLLCQAAIAGVHLAEQVREREKEAGR